MCPSYYDELVGHVVGEGKLPHEILDIFCCPDYEAYIQPHRDQSFGNYKTKESTQLIFDIYAVDPKVEPEFAVPGSDGGAKYFYRATHADSFVEIVSTDENDVGLKPRQVDVRPGYFIFHHPTPIPSARRLTL